MGAEASEYSRADTNILLYTDMSEGHFGATTHRGQTEDHARMYTFALYQRGIVY